ncbi:hypothetical protein Lfu02_72820 [Longispora fulva]|uniref:DUF402 domain-containing protein n=1 Tax=Longispora fulva TaxID=619741 RepID=A0A8J7GAN8_9ACTN|nr:DUF402 domain-containing protein [Longispora fulva]MBG6133871.1 hypothetical protein [Longispora fulva]GIG62910.1 hypothetical protein Lfu02_72820 [Longispora fulva]
MDLVAPAIRPFPGVATGPDGPPDADYQLVDDARGCRPIFPGSWQGGRMSHEDETGRLVTVIRDGVLRAVGLRRGGVVAYDWGFEKDGRAYTQRSFVLLDDGVQINQPALFPAEQRGWWYCDLVAVADHGDSVAVDDLLIDVIVGPPDHPYRMLDLDEYADAMASGRLDAVAAADGLRRVQRFLDRRLNRRHDTTRTWPSFPPREVADLQTAVLPQDWELLTS